MSAENSSIPREHAQRVLHEEAEALRLLAERLDGSFDAACERMRNCPGRVVVTGMGKSGHVGRKIAGTLASTGTPSLFLHPAEALHGDLGMVTETDVVLALSYSGETDELLAILPAIRRRAAVLIAMTGNTGSTLAQAADIVLDVRVPREACTLKLAPTTSTTAMIALGDALAVATMEARGFREEDYALLHPAGSLGRRLLLRVGDVMRTGENIALLPETAVVRDVFVALPRAHQSAAIIAASDGTLAGLITSGDLRRAMERFGDDCMTKRVTEIMTRSPLTIAPDDLAAEGLRRFRNFYADIHEIPVVTADRRPVGMLMLKDVLKAGIV
ncbi:MAG: KpsF/GutQ family sugar-phosphate isomerase [Capsulimonadales bacterium]|nr:KpsF/GutQ family sugar-phosphate isomerase [Capsulimonadales bacterium]